MEGECARVVSLISDETRSCCAGWGRREGRVQGTGANAVNTNKHKLHVHMSVPVADGFYQGNHTRQRHPIITTQGCC